ncbi:lipopolysaccharide biosynthesis protein [Pararhizobium mangrovi]|uniref:lipopolysaccharide biosynthesis protein n=1 Tax=Pararhizobium mangrovi TaxID=2590452 RepID=UPI0015E83376|nr:lipopolysaccharide biosynthesis protein [Pararhizobium mangrovi]
MKRIFRHGATGGGRGVRALLGNASFLVGGRTVTAILSLAYLAIAARSLGVTEFGLLTLVSAYAQTVGDVAEFKSWQVVVQYGMTPFREGRIGDFRHAIRFAVFLDLLAGIGGTIVALIAAYFFAGALGWPSDLLPVGMAFSTSVLFTASTFSGGVLRLMDRFDLYAAPGAIGAVIRLVGSLAVWGLGGGLGWFLVVWYVSTLASFLASTAFALHLFHRHYGSLDLVRGGGRRLGADMPGIWRFVWSINLSSTLGVVTNRAATLAVGAFFGAHDAGLFRIARQVSTAAARPAKLMTPVLYPELARLYSEGATRALRLLALRISLVAGGIGTLALLVLVLFGGHLIALAFGPAYADAKMVMLWLFGAAIVGIWGLPLEPMLVSTGHATLALVLRAVSTAAYLAVLFPAMRGYGLEGVGSTTLLAAIVLFFMQLGAVVQQARRDRAMKEVS